MTDSPNPTTPLQVLPIIDVEKFTSEIMEEITDLTSAMRTQTARAAYYGIKSSEAKKQAARIDLHVKAVTAALNKHHRAELQKAAADDAEQNGGKPERITADMVQSAVLTDPRMMKLLNIQLEADEVAEICKVAYFAFKTRQEMLTSMGHMTRAQMQTNLTIRSAKDNVERYRQRRAGRENTEGPAE